MTRRKRSSRRNAVRLVAKRAAQLVAMNSADTDKEFSRQDTFSLCTIRENLRGACGKSIEGRHYYHPTRATGARSRGKVTALAGVARRRDAQRALPRFTDLGGIGACLDEVRKLIEYPLAHPEMYLHLNVEPPRGILLHGPPGCGKTTLAHAIAGELGVPMFKACASELISGVSGESEEKVRQVFAAATEAAPSIILIDDVDAIVPKREILQRGMERRIAAQILSCMDSLSRQAKSTTRKQEMRGAPHKIPAVIVIGCTSRLESIDAALRRAGRFDREICLCIPDTRSRHDILRVITRHVPLEEAPPVDFRALAEMTPGYVGADLKALVKEAAAIAINRALRQANGMQSRNLRGLYLSMGDFVAATKKVQPSSKREGFASVPTVTWDDIGALFNVRKELAAAITEPIRAPQRFAAMGIKSPSGVLLYGPPGCGKTLLVKAIANECNASFISVKGPELLSKYVGESEKTVRQVFLRARASAPCIIFFDEIDSLCPRRGGSSSSVSERVVNQLLTEMDGLEERQNVFIIAASNRPDIIDPAILRPGRLDRRVYVPLPSTPDRISILRTLSRNVPLDKNVDLAAIGNDRRCEYFSGADLAALFREAAVSALLSTDAACSPENVLAIQREHFEAAFQKVKPSVSVDDQLVYESLRNKM